MNTKEKLLDVVRVYRTYGESHARARLVYHGWSVDDPKLLETMLGAVPELVERIPDATPVQEAI